MVKDQDRALREAAAAGSVARVTAALQGGARLDGQEPFGRPQELEKDPEICKGRTALMIACAHGHANIVTLC